MAILTRLLLCFLLLTSSGIALAASPPVRLKDIAHVLGARENQLMGFGLVVGLNNTGDRTQNGFTQQALTNLMSRMGVVPQSVDFKSRNVAAVIVTATLPPFVKPGQKLDVTVSSVGDANSLQGGTLLTTPLQGVDDQVYAVAQGSLLVGLEPQISSLPYVQQKQMTVGRVPGGALVEKEVNVSLEGKGTIAIILNEPDFTTANRVVDAIRRSGLNANANDAGAVSVASEGYDLVSLIAEIENLTVMPDAVAKIVVNERTGTVVIGENVVIAPVAISYGGIDVVIGDIALYSYGSYSDAAVGTGNSLDYNTAATKARLKRGSGKVSLISATPTLSSLVRALNLIGASPKDLIAILQAMRKSGAIKAEIEVI